MTVTAWVSARRSLLFLIVMMLLVIYINAKNATEHTTARRYDTANHGDDIHKASPLPLGQGAKKCPPILRERAALLQCPRGDRIAYRQYTKIRHILQGSILAAEKSAASLCGAFFMSERVSV